MPSAGGGTVEGGFRRREGRGGTLRKASRSQINPSREQLSQQLGSPLYRSSHFFFRDLQVMHPERTRPLSEVLLAGGASVTPAGGDLAAVAMLCKLQL